MTSDWRISADERAKYETYFQQCGPVQGFLSGEQARDFFVRSNLPGEILRKIWDLADLTSDGRLDKREFSIACHLIATQVQKKGPLPVALPASLIADASTPTNGLPSNIIPTSVFPTASAINLLSKTSPSPLNVPVVPINPQMRAKYLQQFHSLVDVSKTNGFMTGLQAKNILQQTGLSHMILHQIWNLADHDRDGRLTADEFVVAMHCCEIARSGQILPMNLPEDWLTNAGIQRERTDSIGKTSTTPTFAALNQQLKDTFGVTSSSSSSSLNQTGNSETSEPESKLSMMTYEEKRLKNYEDGNRELERRRQLLREQEEREQREREERERKRELELQKQKEEQDKKRQIEIERQLEKQRQIEQQREEERRKLFEQREAARKELERKNRLEWERQRMQELSSQKSRLLDQINDLKSREKALELELQSMDDTRQTCVTRVEQTNTLIHSMDDSLTTIQRNIETERNQLEIIEEKKRSLLSKSSTLHAEREALDENVNQLQQSKEFGMTNRESEILKNIESHIEQAKQETARIDEEILSTQNLLKSSQNKIEELQSKLNDIDREIKTQKPLSPVNTTTTPTNSVPIGFANFSPFDIQATGDSTNVTDVDPFQTVDPFAATNDLSSSTANTDWFQPTQPNVSLDAADPFAPSFETKQVSAPEKAPPRVKKAAPKLLPTNKESNSDASITADPWGTPATSTNNGNGWAKFGDGQQNNTDSPFGFSENWSEIRTVSNGKSTTDVAQYRVLYDYVAERPDEMSISAGDIITVDLSQQQDQHWLFGHIDDTRKGVFPLAYTELISTEVIKTPTSDAPTFDTTSKLTSGIYAVAIADCQGKTPDKHLSFVKGDTILVRDQKDSAWYSGQLRGKIGWFPRNHVRPATEVEIQNIRNSNPNTPTSEKAISSSTSLNGISSQSQVTKVPVYEAIYAYEATDPSDLSFEVGEKILVLKDEGDWWTGRIANRLGTFPNNYIQPVQQQNEAEETANAIKAYDNSEEGFLKFEMNQTIVIRSKTNDGWFLGETRLTDNMKQFGWFPSNCVQSSKTSTPTSATKGSNHYIAIFPYDAQQEDELSFPADAVLEILDTTNPSGWFKAKLGDQVGLIPSTYVQILDIPNP